MGVIPNSTTPNRVLVSRGSGQNDSSWADLVVTIIVPYFVPGDIEVADGPTNYLSPFTFSVPDGQEATLVGVWGVLRAGSCVIDIDHNGSGIPGLESLTIDTTNTYFQPTDPVPVADGDLFAPVVDSV